MKHSFLFLFLLLGIIPFFSSCNEDAFTDWRILNEQWLENPQNTQGFTKTESGLYFRIIHAGDVRFPNTSSFVIVNYEGKLIDGTVFDQGRYERYLSSAIRGWQEGLRRIRGGGRIILYIPAHLAYGEEGSGSIPPHSVLKFDMTLVRSID